MRWEYLNALHSLFTNFRRTGQTRSQPTYVNFTTVSVPGPNNATGQSDCRANGTVTGDFCLVNERLTFSPRKTKLTLSVKIYDNTIAEGPEQFSIKLTNPEGCQYLPQIQPPQLVWITDYEDCEYTVLVQYCRCVIVVTHLQYCTSTVYSQSS